MFLIRQIQIEKHQWLPFNAAFETEINASSETDIYVHNNKKKVKIRNF